MNENYEKEDKMSLGDKVQRAYKMGCLLFVLTFVAIIVLIVSRPTFFWKPVANFLNKDVEVIEVLNLTSEEAKSQLNTQLQTNESLTEVIITEDFLNTISREQVKELPYLTFEFTEDKIEAYWELNAKDGVRLIGFIELVAQDEIENGDVFTDLKINNIGIPRITVPRLLHKPLFNSVQKIFEFTGESTENESLLFKLLGTNSIYEIQDLKIEQDQLVVILNTNNSFYD